MRTLCSFLLDPLGSLELRRWPSLPRFGGIRVEGRERWTVTPLRTGVRARSVRGQDQADSSALGLTSGPAGLRPACFMALDVADQPSSSGRAVRYISAISSREAGVTLTSPVTVMKFVSPPQRGTTWAWTCSGSPAPAAAPRLIPMLMP